MLTTSHLLERVSSAFIHLFYCFRENLFTSYLLSNIWKHISIRSQVSYELLIRENILCSPFQKQRNSWTYRLIKLFQAPKKLSMAIAGFPVIRNWTLKNSQIKICIKFALNIIKWPFPLFFFPAASKKVIVIPPMTRTILGRSGDKGEIVKFRAVTFTRFPSWT